MEFLEPEKEILDEDINEFLKEDLALAEKPLSKVATLRVSQGQKDFFDYLHLSPLKVSRFIISAFIILTKIFYNQETKNKTLSGN